MRKIYKYELLIIDEQKLVLPRESKILSVAEQSNQIVLYAFTENKNTVDEEYKIIIHGTGHNASDIENYRFLGTVKLMDGRLMFHVFSKKND
jgi:hypothetical protein